LYSIFHRKKKGRKLNKNKTKECYAINYCQGEYDLENNIMEEKTKRTVEFNFFLGREVIAPPSLFT